MPPVTTSETQDQQPSGSSSTSILKERRFKLSRACDRCRRRRIKCDEGHPCQACLTANSACTFEEPGKRTHPHKSKRAATLEDRMHHLETLIQAIPPAVFAAGGAFPNPSSGHPPAENPSSPVVPFLYSDGIASGVPPPSLHVFPIMGPSSHFAQNPKVEERQQSPHQSFSTLFNGPFYVPPTNPNEDLSRVSLTASYLYFDDEGDTRWQGETSGLPVLDLLVERHTPAANQNVNDNSQDANGPRVVTAADLDWFPNRQPRRTEVNAGILWRLIASHIPSELMDSLVQCYLSTSYYILPFLHVPTFLEDYGNPQKWKEPGFAAFIVAICCLASRHMDDPRVRADATDGISAGTHWFELFNKLRTLPMADRPTLYNIQANLIAAVYGVGLGRLSKAAALLAQAVTMSIDAGLHRSADTYDLFDPIEDEVRKRTFWCVYIWDKQLGAHFGRPSMLRLRDCDVQEPSPVDDEYITRESIGTPPPGTECRLSAFIVALRIMVVLEAVLDVPPDRPAEEASSFLNRATKVLSGGRRFKKEMREEEALLDDIHRNIPPYWSHSPETLNSDEVIRFTQAERLYCAEHFVRLLIYRHRFSELVAERTNGPVEEEQTEAEREALIAAHNSAVQIVTTYGHIAKKALMTYYGVHVIHQLTQAGRTLVAVLLCCKTEALQHLIPPGLDSLRQCIYLLRRFSGRYVCGLRSGDLMEEFCRLTNIPLETSLQDPPSSNTRPPWIRPVRKKLPSIARSNQSGDSPSHHSSPESFSPSDFFADPVKPTPGAGTAFPPSVPSASSSTPGPNNHVPPPAHYATPGAAAVAAVPPPTPQQTNGSPFMDTSAATSPSASSSGGAGMSIDSLIRDDPNLYMSHEMMSLFDTGMGMDAHLFGQTELFGMQQQQQQMASMASTPSSNGNGGFASPAFLKMSGLGLATSP